MHIRTDDLAHPAIIQLLQEHLQSMTLHSPPESIHALDLDALHQPDITFWSAWDGKELLGCAALKQLDPGHGEVKSMRTARDHLRKGVAAGLMLHLIEEAGQRGYHQLSLETGSAQVFVPAHELYAKFGFVFCKPFGDYIEDPYSVFMTRELRAAQD